jgi:hypothetical protein
MRANTNNLSKKDCMLATLPPPPHQAENTNFEKGLNPPAGSHSLTRINTSLLCNTPYQNCDSVIPAKIKKIWRQRSKAVFRTIRIRNRIKPLDECGSGSKSMFNLANFFWSEQKFYVFIK